MVLLLNIITMTGYDFDKTIYDGNCFVDFYFYCLLRRPYIALLLPFQLIVCVLYLLRVINKKIFKQTFHHYLFFIFDKEKLVNNFWQSHIKKIKPWYLKQQQPDDVVISASPEFFLQVACDMIGIKNLVATKMDERTGIIHGDNCCGSSKVKMFQQAFGANAKLDGFYTDSRIDIPMLLFAEKGYFVRGDVITEYCYQ